MDSPLAARPPGVADRDNRAVFDARPPFSVLKTLETGPITNHVNFSRNARGTFPYVTVGGLNEVSDCDLPPEVERWFTGRR